MAHEPRTDWLTPRSGSQAALSVLECRGAQSKRKTTRHRSSGTNQVDPRWRKPRGRRRGCVSRYLSTYRPIDLILGTEEQTIHGVNSHPRRRSQCDTRWTRVRLRYKSFFPSILDVGPSSHTDRFVQPSPPLDSDMYGGRVPPTIVCLIAHLEQAGLDTPKLFGSDVRTLPRAT